MICHLMRGKCKRRCIVIFLYASKLQAQAKLYTAQQAWATAYSNIV